jgi:hypothetical protein
VLAPWARTGFSDPRPKIAHALGRSGRIAAILFGDLVSPPHKDSGNKILRWSGRTDALELAYRSS